MRNVRFFVFSNGSGIEISRFRRGRHQAAGEPSLSNGG
ncbi:hypothetical protein B4113_1608 [Geobacillus sp. B4113_201601]|nr:hypothetical protein B4113_1608 [Geobacillus sp. B4113_201601]